MNLFDSLLPLSDLGQTPEQWSRALGDILDPQNGADRWHGVLCAGTHEEVSFLNDFRRNSPQFTSRIRAAAGIHPWTSKSLHWKYLEAPDVIGEIGLDRSDRHKNDFELQLQAFELELLRASQLDLPVLVHCVRAHNSLMSNPLFLKRLDRTCFHAYHSSPEVLEFWLTTPCVFSLDARYLRAGSRKWNQKIVERIPMEKVLIESSGAHGVSSLATLKNLIEHISQIKSLPKQEVADAIWQNSCRFWSFEI